MTERLGVTHTIKVVPKGTPGRDATVYEAIQYALAVATVNGAHLKCHVTYPKPKALTKPQPRRRARGAKKR